MRQVIEALHKMVRAQCKPIDGLRITLSPVPDGDNVARGRKFESSDPNKWWNGLTDGSWGETYRNTYSTGTSDVFPKWVTIELGGNKKVAAVRLGVPSYGSTSTVEIGLSKNGKKFTDVGEVTFAQGIANRRTLRIEPKFAKYVRLVFRDRHPKRVVHDPNTLFLTEVEVYGP